MNWVQLCQQSYKDWRRFKKWLQEHGKEHEPLGGTLVEGDHCALAKWVRFDLMAEHDLQAALKQDITVHSDGSVTFWPFSLQEKPQEMLGALWNRWFKIRELAAFESTGKRITTEEALDILDSVVGSWIVWEFEVNESVDIIRQALDMLGRLESELESR